MTLSEVALPPKPVVMFLFCNHRACVEYRTRADQFDVWTLFGLLGGIQVAAEQDLIKVFTVDLLCVSLL